MCRLPITNVCGRITALIKSIRLFCGKFANQFSVVHICIEKIDFLIPFENSILQSNAQKLKKQKGYIQKNGSFIFYALISPSISSTYFFEKRYLFDLTFVQNKSLISCCFFNVVIASDLFENIFFLKAT